MNPFIAVKPPRVLALTGLLLTALVLDSPQLAAATVARTVPVTLGDYRFSPDRINVQAGETIQLELTNRDKLTPHNFTLKADEAGLDVDVDVGAGKTVVVEITPRTSGTYRFYCNKKLPFMKSHQARGMEGTLAVIPSGRQ